MPQGSRAARVGDLIRAELAELLVREVHDPGIGFLTIVRVKVSPDLLQARVFYTTLGDDKARRETAKALGRATPFLRRQIGRRLQLKRVPELAFMFDDSIEKNDRIAADPPGARHGTGRTASPGGRRGRQRQRSRRRPDPEGSPTR